MILERYGGYKLLSYDPVTLSLPDFFVTDDEVQTEMGRIAARHATNITIDPHPINADDMVLINIKTMDGNNPFAGLTHDHVDVQLGIGYLPEPVEHAMLGHEVGDTVTVEYAYDDYSKVSETAQASGESGPKGEGESGPEEVKLVTTVEILAIRTFITPDITDEWVHKSIARANTVDEFAKNTRVKLERQRTREYVNNIEYAIMREIGARLIGEPPADAVDEVEKQMTQEFDKFLEQYEMDRETYLKMRGRDAFQFGEQVHEDAIERVSEDIALAVWAEHFGIELEDSDIDFMFGEPTPEKTYAARVEAEATGRIDMFKDLALRAKVARQIAKDATYLDSKGDVDSSFKDAVDMKYKKQDLVRAHATSDPMLKPPMVPIKDEAKEKE